MMIIGQKILLKPTHSQMVVFNKSFGVSRYAYNWALERWKKLKSEGVKLVSINALKKEWNQVKPEWVYDSPKDANQQPFSDLQRALKNYFNSKKKGDNHYGFPTKKKRGKSRDSFYVSNDKAHITNNYIKLPLVGKVKMVEPLRHNRNKVKILSYTVSRTADRYYVSVNYELPDSMGITHSEKGIVGVDLGLKSFAVESNGHNEPSVKAQKNTKKLKRLQRKLSRAKKGSIRRTKVKIKLARKHARVVNIRKDHLHKYSRKIVDENVLIVLEDLNISGMLKNHKLSKAISDASWAEFKRMVEYKAIKSGSIVISIDRWFHSSKLCSQCDAVKQHIGLDEREYICEHCGCIIDRDLNAAINILAFALFQIIPRATGKFTSVEIVALCQRFIADVTTVDETFLRSDDGRWNKNAVMEFLRQQFDFSINQT